MTWAQIGKLLALVALSATVIFVIYGVGRSAGSSKVQAEWDADVIRIAGLNAQAIEEARQEERRRYAENEKVASDARQQAEQAKTDGAGADSAGDRLRNEASKFASESTGCDPTIAQRSKAATSAAMVLSDMFQRADRAAGELAKAYDQSRIAGLACEAAYDSLRASSR